MEYHVYWLLKSSCFELSGDENTVFFELKSWWKDDIYWLLESPCFELFGGGRYGFFLAKMLMKRRYLLITEKLLFWTFWRWEIRSFLSQKVDGKMIFIWDFELSMMFQDLGNMVFRAMELNYYCKQTRWLKRWKKIIF